MKLAPNRTLAESGIQTDRNGRVQRAAYGPVGPSLVMSLMAARPAAAAEAVAADGTLDGIGVLATLVQTAIVPGLARRHVADGRPRAPRAPPPHPYATDLARLLIADDPDAALTLLRHVYIPGHSILPLYATLFEPAARALGDLWAQDLCSETDVTIALGRLQTAMRVLGARKDADAAAEAFPVHTVPPSVLVAPEPGEVHALGAVLDCDTLSRAGWSPQSEFPATDKALQDLLHTTWFDALDLTLSAVFSRQHWLPRMSETIRGARRASLNPALLVVVGGRVFTEHRKAAQSIGADAFCITALQLRQLIQVGLSRGRDNL